MLPDPLAAREAEEERPIQAALDAEAVATIVPARRVLRIDPAEIMRTD